MDAVTVDVGQADNPTLLRWQPAGAETPVPLYGWSRVGRGVLDSWTEDWAVCPCPPGTAESQPWTTKGLRPTAALGAALDTRVPVGPGSTPDQT